MEKIDAQGSDAVWGDDDLAFDLDLENFGVDTNQYKEDVPSRLFHAWVEDWELEHLKKQCPLSETLLLQKYKNLSCSTSPTIKKRIKLLSRISSFIGAGMVAGVSLVNH